MRVLSLLTFAALTACAAKGGELSGDDDGSGAGTTSMGGMGGEGAGFTNVGGGSGGADPNEIAEVYGHSADTLYALIPETNAVGIVGDFNGCNDVIDLAIDENNDIVATTMDGLYHVDKNTAACTLIQTGTYPNSLSFVPRGTLDPNVEALVGYDVTDYVRIDPTTGNVSVVAPGAITGGYESSGDIVSVKDGGTYLTIKGGDCDDCLVEVNPATGGIVTNFGSVGASQVFGLAYWGGVAYGFTNDGLLFAFNFQGNTVTTTPIPINGAPMGLQFWGAGSSTSVPVDIPR